MKKNQEFFEKYKNAKYVLEYRLGGSFEIYNLLIVKEFKEGTSSNFPVLLSGHGFGLTLKKVKHDACFNLEYNADHLINITNHRNKVMLIGPSFEEHIRILTEEDYKKLQFNISSIINRSIDDFKKIKLLIKK